MFTNFNIYRFRLKDLFAAVLVAALLLGCLDQLGRMRRLRMSYLRKSAHYVELEKLERDKVRIFLDTIRSLKKTRDSLSSSETYRSLAPMDRESLSDGQFKLLMSLKQILDGLSESEQNARAGAAEAVAKADHFARMAREYDRTAAIPWAPLFQGGTDENGESGKAGNGKGKSLP